MKHILLFEGYFDKLIKRGADALRSMTGTKAPASGKSSNMKLMASGTFNGVEVGSKSIFISIAKQKLYLLVNGAVTKEYPISSAKAGVGTEPNSNKTPSGLHRVKERIGAKAKIGEIIKGGTPTGKITKIFTDKTDVASDYITTRVMWLDGVEPENKNTHERYVYIHGTPEEGLVGTPHSHGCIRMKNADVLDLFNQTPSGTYVYIDKA